MEPTGGFDQALALQLLLDIAQEQSLEPILKRIVAHAVKHSTFVFSQVWLIGKGDLCATCKYRTECPDQSRCLHLVAGKGRSIPSPGKGPRPYEDLDARVPLNFGPLGEAVATGQPRRMERPEEPLVAIAGFDWFPAEGIRGYGISPIRFRGEVLGALMGFTRERLPVETRSWGRIFADHIAAAIGNARAFEEIQRLKAQLELQNTYLQEEVVEARAFGDLIGRSGVLRQLVSQIEVVAPTEASVLILGETGTGKELVAHELHRHSQRRQGPLVRVNCASIPRELFESELFGHVRGSFSGAIKDRAGRIETAERGTLFLDEIGELPLDMQSKLLRFLQEKKYERIGEDRTRQADVRIIGATNRNLKEAVAAGRFREDLYYRLHVFPIQVAPLRKRKEDIPLLANHFIDVSVRDLKCAKPRLTRAAVAELLHYDWPGNIRELRNVVERAVILARGGALRFDLSLSGDPVKNSPRLTPPTTVPEPSFATPKLLTEVELRNLERDNLLATLQTASWRIEGPGGAAELLGVKSSTLHSRMLKWGLKKPEAALLHAQNQNQFRTSEAQSVASAGARDTVPSLEGRPPRNSGRREHAAESFDSTDSHLKTSAGSAIAQASVRPGFVPSEKQWQILDFCDSPKSLQELMKHVGARSRPHFRHDHLEALVAEKLIRLSAPSNPTSPRQAYVLTETGLALLTIKKRGLCGQQNAAQ